LTTVLLVPRREGFEDRDRIWDFCRAWWQQHFPDWLIYEGHHEVGLFNRSAAMNTAAALAGDWDVAVVIDADVLPDPAKVQDAHDRAIATGLVCFPFDVRYNLNPRGTAKVLQGHKGSWKGFIARTYHQQHSSVFAITRQLWDATGGFDEGFSGWGLEDTAFAMSCEVFSGGKGLDQPGEVWHLYHAAAPEQKHGTPSHMANMARKQLYDAAWQAGDKVRLRELVAQGRTIEHARHTDSIPTTLHRVVPADTPQQAEDWWSEWGRLHPGWRLLTWRDPIDPNDFPISSPHWPAEPGARLADLVRLEALLTHGGIYVDMDMQPFRPLDPLLDLQAFAAWEDTRTVPNAILGARPGHPAIRECLALCIQRQRGNVWDAGPGVTTQVLQNRADVLLLPPHMFYAVHYNDPQRDTLMYGKPSAWEYARHHYWMSWGPPARNRTPAA
jgi:mannosyltransferase OCH1-like enzyme